MKNLPTFYATKMAYGPEVVRAIREGMAPVQLDDPLEITLNKIAQALGKRVPELVVMTLNRPRHAEIIAQVRKCGSALRLISDGDITAAVSPSLADSGVDLFYGIGGSPEGILTAAALKALGGEMLLRMWPRDDAERASVLQEISAEDLPACGRLTSSCAARARSFAPPASATARCCLACGSSGKRPSPIPSSCARKAAPSATSARCMISRRRRSICAACGRKRRSDVL